MRDRRALFSSLLALSIAMVLVSIAVSQLLLGAALLGRFWLSTGRLGRMAALDHRSRSTGHHRGMPPIAWPLLFFFLWTILAALVSHDPLRGLTISKKFFIFLLVFLVPLVLKGRGKQPGSITRCSWWPDSRPPWGWGNSWPILTEASWIESPGSWVNG